MTSLTHRGSLIPSTQTGMVSGQNDISKAKRVSDGIRNGDSETVKELMRYKKQGAALVPNQTLPPTMNKEMNQFSPTTRHDAMDAGWRGDHKRSSSLQFSAPKTEINIDASGLDYVKSQKHVQFVETEQQNTTQVETGPYPVNHFNKSGIGYQNKGTSFNQVGVVFGRSIPQVPKEAIIPTVFTQPPSMGYGANVIVGTTGSEDSEVSSRDSPSTRNLYVVSAANDSLSEQPLEKKNTAPKRSRIVKFFLRFFE